MSQTSSTSWPSKFKPSFPARRSTKRRCGHASASLTGRPPSATASGRTQPPCIQTLTARLALCITSMHACGSDFFSAWTKELSSPEPFLACTFRPHEVGSLRVRRKSDVPLLPNSEKPTWVRIADPTASEIALTKDSKESLAWLLSCVQSTPTKPLSDPHLLHCLSAADAMAEGDTVALH